MPILSVTILLARSIFSTMWNLNLFFSVNTDKLGSSSYWGGQFCCRCLPLSVTRWCSCKPEMLFLAMFMLKEGLFRTVPARPVVFGKLQWKRLWMPLLRDSLFFQMNVNHLVLQDVILFMFWHNPGWMVLMWKGLSCFNTLKDFLISAR